MKSALKSMNEKKVTSNETDTPVTMENDLPLLDRNLYKTIKKMDRALINDIYESGRKKGAEEAVSAASDSEVSSDNSVSNQENSCGEDTVDDNHTLDLRVLEKNIRKVKGIGEKRTEEVMVIIEQWLGV